MTFSLTSLLSCLFVDVFLSVCVSDCTLHQISLMQNRYIIQSALTPAAFHKGEGTRAVTHSVQLRSALLLIINSGRGCLWLGLGQHFTLMWRFCHELPVFKTRTPRGESYHTLQASCAFKWGPLFFFSWVFFTTKNLYTLKYFYYVLKRVGGVYHYQAVLHSHWHSLSDLPCSREREREIDRWKYSMCVCACVLL